MVVRSCTLCGDVLVAVSPEGARARFECPSCRHQEARDPCPSCGGVLAKDVLPPEGVEIEEGGLPLERCLVAWRCRCGFLESAPEGV